MKNTEIKALSVGELQEKLASEKENLKRLQFGNSISPLENPMKIRQARKLVARLSTEYVSKQKNK